MVSARGDVREGEGRGERTGANHAHAKDAPEVGRRGDEGEPGSESVAVEYKHKHAKKQSFRPSN